jgi:hypothetical protein
VEPLQGRRAQCLPVSDLRGYSRTREPEHVLIVLFFFSVVVPGGPVDGEELAFDVSPVLIFPRLVILIFYTYVNSLTILLRRGSTFSMSETRDKPGYSDVKFETGKPE